MVYMSCTERYAKCTSLVGCGRYLKLPGKAPGGVTQDVFGPKTGVPQFVAHLTAEPGGVRIPARKFSALKISPRHADSVPFAHPIGLHPELQRAAWGTLCAGVHLTSRAAHV